MRQFFASQSQYSRSPLASKLLNAVLSVYLTVALFVTCLQLVLEYREEKNRLQAELNQVADAFLPVLALALWNLDGVQLTGTVNGVWVSDAIGRIEVTNDLGEKLINRERSYGILEFGNWEPPWYSYQYDIVYSGDGLSDQLVGQLNLASNSIIVAQRATSTFIYTIINAVIKTFLLWAIFYYTLVRLVARPLSTLTKALHRINPDNSLDTDSQEQSLAGLHTDDELGELAVSFTDLEAALIQKNQDIEARQSHLEDTVEELKRVSNAKSTFLAHMSHELRTPLNGILGMIDFLGDSDLDETQAKQVSILENSGNQLLGVINNVLDFSKIESGKLELDAVDFDFRKIADNCAGAFAAIAEKKGLTLQWEIQDSIPAHVRGDPIRITQVLNNLIGNALKFTEYGEVVVSISCENCNEGYTFSISVTDSGAGISEQAQRDLFRSFSQGDKSTTRKFGGTGLGLAISKQLVTAMGGSIGVVSEPEKGSTFSFEITLAQASLEPVALPEMADEAIPNSPQEEADMLFSDMNVLVAEDNPVNQIVISGMLKKLGINADITADGRAAVNMCTQTKRPYDLVFMDIEMPEMDGWEATRELRENDVRTISGNPVKIVGLSAHALNIEVDLTRKCGMDAYLSKPITLDEISRVLRTT